MIETASQRCTEPLYKPVEEHDGFACLDAMLIIQRRYVDCQGDMSIKSLPRLSGINCGDNQIVLF